MGSDNSVRVNAVVSESQRDRWNEYAEENSEYSSLSDLIRTGVEREIQGHNTDNNTQNAIETGEILDKLDELGSRFQSVESRLSSLESEASEEPEVGQLATEVFRILPDKQPGSKEWKATLEERKTDASRGEEEERKLMEWRGSVSSLSELLDEPEYMVQEAIERLQKNTKSIGVAEYGGETRYYKEV